MNYRFSSIRIAHHLNGLCAVAMFSISSIIDNTQYTYRWLYRSVPSMCLIIYAHVSESGREMMRYFLHNFISLWNSKDVKLNYKNVQIIPSCPIWKCCHSNVRCRWIFFFLSLSHYPLRSRCPHYIRNDKPNIMSL